MFKNVIVGVDGTPNGRDAIALAGQLADPDGQLTLVHTYGGQMNLSHVMTRGMVTEEREASEKLLAAERAATDSEAQLLSVEALNPGRGLHEQAEEHGADLIVVGSSRRGVFSRAMLGDDTRAALNGAPCAIAIAARGYGERSGPLAKVGVAYNSTPESAAALARARTLAEAAGATVAALEVVSIPMSLYAGIVAPALGESIPAILKEADERLARLPGVDGHAVFGIPGEELAVFSASVDLLVVGSRSYGAMMRLVVGSTSDYLERHARSSLLVLPRVASAA
jgi:nucleotide-binding universal stress UspA family protein